MPAVIQEVILNTKSQDILDSFRQFNCPLLCYFQPFHHSLQSIRRNNNNFQMTGTVPEGFYVGLPLLTLVSL